MMIISFSPLDFPYPTFVGVEDFTVMRYITHMLKIWTVVFPLAFLVASIASAEVDKGSNLIVNGQFEADQAALPPFWSYPGETSRLKWSPQGGPDGLPYLTVVGSTSEDLEFRQWGLALSSNGTYRLSFLARTRGGAGVRANVYVANAGWHQAAVAAVPSESEGRWTKVEQTFKCFPSHATYMAIVSVGRFSGEVDIAKIRLEAADEVALRETEPPAIAAAQHRPRLVPRGTRLGQIPNDDRRATFRFYGKLPKGTHMGDYEIRLSASDVPDASSTVPLKSGDVSVPLPIGAQTGILTVSVWPRRGESALTTARYRYRTIEPVRISGKGHRRLNNFVTELLSVELPGGDADQTFEAPRNGWVFVSVSDGEESEVSLDGLRVIDPSLPRAETFRRIARGTHRLQVRTKGRVRLVVRSVGEIFNYPYASSFLKEIRPYDDDFHARYVLPGVTTFCGGAVPASVRAQGYGYFSDVGTGCPKDAKDVLNRLRATPHMKNPTCDGIACDEQFFMTPSALDDFTRGLLSYDLAAPSGKRIYSWTVGKPSVDAIDPAYLSAAANVSLGEGRILLESYCRAKPDETSARQYLKSYLTDAIRAMRRFDPESPASTLMILANFNQTPYFNIAAYPENDHKYYLDMQLNQLANDTTFADIAGTGYWGTYYADEEMVRWSFALMRHYVVEGRTGMLSDRYGFTFAPGHLLNGDFRSGLEGWTASGDVRTETCPGAGGCEARWGCAAGLGDTAAVLTRGEGADGVATLEQMARGLTVGKTYVFQLAAFDADDLRDRKIDPKKLPVQVEILSGGTVDEARSWCHVDRRPAERMKNPRINLRHLVFTATAAEAKIRISNPEARPGERDGVNMISLNPHFEN